MKAERFRLMCDGCSPKPEQVDRERERERERDREGGRGRERERAIRKSSPRQDKHGVETTPNIMKTGTISKTYHQCSVMTYYGLCRLNT